MRQTPRRRTGSTRCSPAAVTSAIPHATASDLFWSDMPASGMWLAAGRKERPVHVRERVRLDLFVRIADTLLG